MALIPMAVIRDDFIGFELRIGIVLPIALCLIEGAWPAEAPSVPDTGTSVRQASTGRAGLRADWSICR
jgi:hypothetical protein